MAHVGLGRFAGREPALHFRDVALWITCEGLQTSGAAEGVLALGPLESEAVFALLGDVDNHVADRIEHLCAGVHFFKRSPPTGVAIITHPRTGFRDRLARCRVRYVDQVAGGPWDRAGVDRETWYAARTMAAAIRETVRLSLDPSENEALPSDHQRLGEYADDLVKLVERGDPETIAMLLRRGAR